MWVSTCGCSGCRVWSLVASGIAGENVDRACAEVGWIFACRRAERDGEQCVIGANDEVQDTQARVRWVARTVDDGRLGDSRACVGDVQQDVCDVFVEAGKPGVGLGASEHDWEKPEIVGKWAKQNRRKKERKRQSVKLGFCETVVSSCSSYEQALSDAERQAKETFAKKRAAQNKLDEKLALMKLASLEDEKKCQEYSDLKRQRVIQWTNEATAKSQQSLDKCKSIDPGSSSSQHDIRQQAKELADLKLYHSSVLECFRQEVVDADMVLRALELPSTETMDMYEAGAGDFEVGMDV